MIIQRMYTIRDNKAECYLSPFFFQRDGEAIRAFDDVVNKSGSQINAHPEDFSLFKVGEFDQDTGSVTPIAPISLGCALDFLKKGE